MYRVSKKRVAHIVVTHGKVVSCFAKYCSGSNKGSELEGKINIPRTTPYNGIATLAIHSQKWRLLRGGDNKHVK